LAARLIDFFIHLEETLNMLLTKKITPVALATTLALSGLAAPTVANADLSGNIGVHSKYLLRGIFEENPGAAVQGGFDWSGESGLYLGYWGSSLGYSYSDNPANPYTANGFENDLYGGYAASIGDFGYDVGLIQYVYLNVDNSDLTEVSLKGTFMDGYVRAQVLTNDGWWGNAGDTYWTAGYSFSLPKDLGLAFDYGYYTYNDDDNDELGGNSTGGSCTGCVTTTTSAFRNFNITLSHPVGATGADMYVQYVIAGKDRTGAEYSDSMVMGLTYGFDL
jgi:uncharacterized protein (TIGR02001 family)